MKKFIIFLLLFNFNAADCQSIGFAGASNNNSQLLLNDSVIPVESVQKDTTGRTTSIPTIGSGTLILLVHGQSIPTNTVTTPFTPTNITKVLQLNIYDQTIYQAIDPELGTTGNGAIQGGNYITRLADNLVTNAKFGQVVIVNAAWGGTDVFDWASGQMQQRARISCLMVRAKGWLTSGATFWTIYDQGQGDATNPPGTTTLQWEQMFATYRQTQVALGCNFDTFVPIDTLLNGVVSSTIQAAQSGVVDGVKVFAGANTDSLTGANRGADGTHLSDTGSVNNVNLWSTIMLAH